VSSYLFLDSLPTRKYPVRRHQNRVFREKRGHRAGVVLVERLVLPHSERTDLAKCCGIPEEIALLGYSCIDRVFLFSEGR